MNNKRRLAGSGGECICEAIPLVQNVGVPTKSGARKKKDKGAQCCFGTLPFCLGGFVFPIIASFHSKTSRTE